MKKQYRANFYIDGFNFYMGIRDLQAQLRGEGKPIPSTKVNYKLLAEDLLHGSKNLSVNQVKYFSAYPKNNVPRRKRHEEFVRKLKSVGVGVILGEHKRVRLKCKAECKQTYEAYEEKETDVRIALEILADAHAGNFDRAYIMSADSDLVPVVQRIRQDYPKLQIWSVSPPTRGERSKALRKVCHKGIGCGELNIRNNQF